MKLENKTKKTLEAFKKKCKGKNSFFIMLTLILTIIINLYSFSVVKAEESADNDNLDIENSEQTEISVPQNLNLSSINLDDLINIAINNSMQCEIDDLNIEIKEEALKQAYENASFLRDAYGAQNILNNKIIKEVRTFEAETNVEVAKKTKEDNINNLKVNIKKAFQNLLIAQIEQSTENNRLDILMQKYDLLKSKLKQGIITENDLTDIEFSIENKRIDIVKVGEKIEGIKNDIKKLLNVSFSSAFPKIDEDIEFELIKHIDANKAVSNAINNNTSIYRLKKDIEAKQKVLDLTGQYLKETDNSYKNAKYDLEQVKVSLEDTSLSIEVSVRNSYSNILNLRDRVYLAEKYLGILREKLNLAEIKFKNGMVTTDVVLNAKESIINAEYQRYAAIYNYNLAKIDFEARCDIEK